MSDIVKVIEEKNWITKRKQENELNKVLSAQPPKLWIKKKDGIPYLPIDKVEYMLTKLFVDWFPEVREVQLMVNSAVVTVRLWYRSPLDGQLKYSDGVGAAPIHTSKGSAAGDMMNLQAYSVQKAVPSAKSFAIKDAAECIGRIFGSDLNRKDTMNDYKLESDENDRLSQIINDGTSDS